MIRSLISRLVIVVLLVALLMPTFAARKGGAKKAKCQDEVIADYGRINWQKGVLYATGLGAVSRKESNEAKAYLRARMYAKLDALRNLLMVVDHVRIDSRTTGADFEAVSDEIKAEVHGIVRGAQVVAERKIPVGTSMMIEVTVATPLYGEQGIASIFIPEIIRRQQESSRSEPEAQPSPQFKDTPDDDSAPANDADAPPVRNTPTVPEVRSLPPSEWIQEPERATPAVGARYTSLIVDTRGQGVWRCMSPKIRRPDGSEVWGTVNVDPDYVIAHGIVIYAHTIEEAKHLDRAGSNPLIVRAVGKVGGKLGTDPVVADGDAERMLAANARLGFMDRFRVIFVVDAGL